MRKVTISSFLMIMTIVFVSSCGPTLKVSSDYDRSVDFSGYKTFSMYDMKTSGSVNQLNKDRIVKYIRAEMIKKGFTENNSHPDLMVNAVTVLKDKQSLVANTNYSYGGLYRPYGYWGRPASSYTTVSSYEYKDGSLVIDVVDAKTKKMIWEGAGYAQIDKKPKNPEEAISGTVAKIMEAFPARAGK